MPAGRDLVWEGCFNVRDLGGLPTVDGRVTRTGAVVRADSINALSRLGWAALEAHGVRTVVNLRDDVGSDASPRPTSVTTVHVPLDDTADTEMWQLIHDGGLDGSPLYYRPFLERKPDRTAAALRAVAGAQPGGVAIHCAVGRDRTGLVSLLLLDLVGVEPQAIADDYAMSTQRLRAWFAHHDREDEAPLIERLVAVRGTTIRAAALDTLAWLHRTRYLDTLAVSEAQRASLRDRLLDY